MNGIYSLFADVLDYPTSSIFSQVRELSCGVNAHVSEAINFLSQFETALNGVTLEQLQEIYTSSFDMHPDCTPNLGCHLFGEDVRRNIFMAQLRERMDRAQVPTGVELPDHLSLVLRLLDSLDNADETHAVIEDCLIPGVTRILSALKQLNVSCPYVSVFQTLLVTLKSVAPAATATPEAARGPAS